jgi:indole-3-glycerol phosphate synthase
MDTLREIMAWKRREIAPRLRRVEARELAACAMPERPRPSFHAALARPGRLAVIAEMKRRSPSAGGISPGADAATQAERYARAGADAVSVLTDERYFGGTLGDLEAATARFAAQRHAVPCLRKDFMVHPIQVVEAAQAGASAILLIVRALAGAELAELFEAATLAGLDALFEVHTEGEIDRAVEAGARLIGVNNRDLATFQTDLALSERLVPLIPRGIVAVSESGISTLAHAARARACGAHAVLVGEALMRAPDPAALLASFQTA